MLVRAVGKFQYGTKDWFMEQILLSIVIGTYNRIDILKQCLDALIGKIKVANEIIVVDAGSTDGTQDYLQHLQGIHVVCDEVLLGQAMSLNRVFKSLESKYVCWLSDDNIAIRDMLDTAVHIMEKNPGIGLVGLKVRDLSGPNISLPYLGGIWESGILTCNQGLLRTALIKKLGGFDEKLRDYGIDGDLTTRVLLEGYKVVFTKKVAIHHLRDYEADSWTDSSGRKQKMERAKELYQNKYKQLIRSEFNGFYDKEEREKSSLVKEIHHFYALAGKKGISIRNWIDMVKSDWMIVLVTFGMWMGLVEKDWRILLVARFISKWDFLMNINKPYYLVQHIPGGLLQQIADPSPVKDRSM
jgi:GT2 family glycosyltransferase